MWEYHHEGMVYDDEAHSYTLAGRPLAGVTTILKDCNIINNPFYTDQGALNGKRRHLLTEYYDQNRLDWGSIGEADMPYLDAWIKAVKEKKIEIQAIEVRAYHPLLMYAGTIDRLALIDGEPYILDIKTGAEAKPTALQLLLYGMMFLYSGIRPKLKIIYLNGKGNYKPREVSWKDEKFAMAAVRIDQWKRR
ncbi:hypothetical protein KAR91_69700 [Candidatus Pacearchaeota archaeon]|nr:hypothetical protein [Candidatus Pacearchaeota archaeon]